MSNESPERPDQSGTPQGWPSAPHEVPPPASSAASTGYPTPTPGNQQAPAGQSKPGWDTSAQAMYPHGTNAQGTPAGSPWPGATASTPNSNQGWQGAGGSAPAPGWSASDPWGSQGPATGQGGAWGQYGNMSGPYGSQPPGQPADPRAAWTNQSTGWSGQQGGWGNGGAPGQPYPAAGAPNNDPHAPLGGPVPAAVGIDQFIERRSRTPLVVGLVVALAVALALVLGSRAINRPQPAPTPTATTSSASTRPSASVASGNTAQFENDTDSSTGTWTINKYQWNGDELMITTTVQCDHGTQPMGFFAIANDSETQTYSAVASGRADDVLGKQVDAGQTLTGTVTFHMPRQESTIFITDSNDHQVTALVVQG